MSIPTSPPPSGPPASTSSSQATTSLVLGILGILCCGILAPIAWYLGSAELKKIRAGQSPATAEGTAKAGMILGIIGTVLLVLAIIWAFFMGGMAVLQGVLHSTPH